MGGVSSKEDAKLEPSTSASEPESSSCPVPAQYRNPAIYNVYGQRIDGNQQNCTNPLAKLQGSDLLDPKNNMPLEPNQQPCPGQRVPLSTERLQSNIPKGGTDTTWLYPSPQMFFNGEAAWQRHLLAWGTVCTVHQCLSVVVTAAAMAAAMPLLLQPHRSSDRKKPSCNDKSAYLPCTCFSGVLQP